MRDMITRNEMKRCHSPWARLAAVVSLGMLAASAASADETSMTAVDAADPPAASPPPASGAGEIQEIVVTAQRRAERVMDVPLSVTAYSGEAIAAAGVADTSELQVATPGLIYSKEGASVQFYIRGVGNEVPVPGAESSVAFYIDGVYVTQMIGSFDNFADLERIEVLQGPQGTLYGRNALGGAINITTKAPSRDALVADVSATVGNYGRKQESAYISAPINDKIAFSLAATRLTTDGWVRNAFNGQEVENENYYDIRMKVTADLTENTPVTLAFDRFWRNDSRNAVFGAATDVLPAAAVLPQAPVLAATLPPGPVRNSLANLPDRPALYANGEWTVYNDTAPIERDLVQGISLKIAHTFGLFEMTSISSYRDLRSFSQADADGTNRPIEIEFSDPQRGRTAIEDVNFASLDKVLGVSWLAGASYLHDMSGYLPLAIEDIEFPLAGLPPNIEINARELTTAAAGYVQGTYDIRENLSLTLGLRYNSETKKLLEQNTIVPLFGLTLPTQGAAGSETTWNSFPLHGGLQYKPSADWMLYFAVDRGYKSGLYDVTNTNPPPASCSQNCSVPVNQEELIAYQAGVKGRLFDGRAEVELSGFHYDYKNLQTSVVNSLGSPIIQNAANATIDGADFKVRAALTNHLALQASGSVLADAKYVKFIGESFVADPVHGGFDPVTADMSGNRLPRAPRFSGNIGPLYDIPIGESKLTLSGNLYYSTSYFLDPAQITEVGSYTLMNASAVYKLPDGLSFSLWGRNLGDTRFPQSALLLTSKLLTWNEPRMYGFTVRFQY
jgi:iron complex outermembrane recepter protein